MRLRLRLRARARARARARVRVRVRVGRAWLRVDEVGEAGAVGSYHRLGVAEGACGAAWVRRGAAHEDLHAARAEAGIELLEQPLLTLDHTLGLPVRPRVVEYARRDPLLLRPPLLVGLSAGWHGGCEDAPLQQQRGAAREVQVVQGRVIDPPPLPRGAQVELEHAVRRLGPLWSLLQRRRYVEEEEAREVDARAGLPEPPGEGGLGLGLRFEG